MKQVCNCGSGLNSCRKGANNYENSYNNNTKKIHQTIKNCGYKVGTSTGQHKTI